MMAEMTGRTGKAHKQPLSQDIIKRSTVTSAKSNDQSQGQLNICCSWDSVKLE